jgi:TRAP-type C4-dicarboxylate transport system substrate-binding protein
MDGKAKVALFVIITLLALGSYLPASSQQPAPPGKTVEWNLQHERGPATYNAKALKDFAAQVAQRTGGGFKITIYDGGGLNIPWPEMLSSIQSGAIPIIGGPVAYMAGTDPFFLAESIAGLITSVENHQLYASAIFDLRTKVLAKYNAIELGHWPHDKQIWASRKPLVKPGDFKGVRLRVASPDLATLVRGLGGSPVTMPITEVYVAMQRGAMEGFATGPGAMRGISAWEIAGHLTDLVMSNGGFIVLANKAAYNGLPDSYKAVLREEMYALQLRMYHLTKVNETSEVEFLISKGMKLHKPSPELRDSVVKLVAPYWDKWAKESGPDAQEALKIARGLGFGR